MAKHHIKHVEKKVKTSSKNYYSKYDSMMEEAKKAKLNHDYELAEELLIEVFASDCHLKNKACFELAKVYKDIGNYSKAKWILNILCNEPTFFFDAYYELAMVHMLQNEFNEAEECLTKIKNSFNQFLYHEGMGKLKYYTKRYEEAKTHFQKAIDIKGFISRGNSIRMILIDTKLGNFDEAIRGINEMRSNWFNHTGILLEANIYTIQKKYTDALKAYQRLLNSPYKNVALYRIGYVYTCLRKYKEAASVLNNVYNDIKNNVPIEGIEMINVNNLMYSLIMSYVKDGQYDEAIRVLEDEHLLVNNIYTFYYKVYAFCCRKANKKPIYECPNDLLSYSGFQSKEYSKDAAYTHIYRRHIEDDDKSGTILSSTNINEIWDFAINNLKPEYRTDYVSFPDVYCIKYPNVGLNGEDSLIVVTNPGTDEIITLYPEYKDRFLSRVDDRDEEAKDVYSLSEYTEDDVIVRGLVKED